jgi:hypothetical protein
VTIYGWIVVFYLIHSFLVSFVENKFEWAMKENDTGGVSIGSFNIIEEDCFGYSIFGSVFGCVFQ